MRFLALLVLSASFVGLSASALRSQEKKEPEPPSFYPLTPKNKWEYKLGDRDRYVSTVHTQPKTFGDVPAAKVETWIDNKLIGTEYVAVRPDGIYRYGFNEEKADPPIKLLKLPAKKGDEWTFNVKIGAETLKGTFRTVEDQGTVKVTVEGEKQPRECKLIVVKCEDLDINGLKGSMTVHFAEGVGIVRTTLILGASRTEIELEKFTPAK
jgi:hypothetical protein